MSNHRVAFEPTAHFGVSGAWSQIVFIHVTRILALESVSSSSAFALLELLGVSMEGYMAVRRARGVSLVRTPSSISRATGWDLIKLIQMTIPKRH